MNGAPKPNDKQSSDNAQVQDSQSSPVSEVSQQAPISLPSGGGAIRSMGETFQSNPVTGTASFSVPVKVSPGRSGFTPQLALSYDSGNGNDVFGLGWNVGIPSISRRTSRGLPQYNDQAESDTFLLSGAEDLVPFMDESNGNWQKVQFQKNGYTITRYRPRTEGLFARIERWLDATGLISHWRVTTKDNTTSIYGESALGRVADPEDPKRVFQWLLEKTYDDKGNIIIYEYKAEDQVNVPNALYEEHRQSMPMANRYPKRIKYGNTVPFSPEDATFFDTTKWHFEVILDYGEHDEGNLPGYTETQLWNGRPDAFSTYTAGFEVRTYRLCQRILMYHHFAELSTGPTPEPYLVCATELNYDLKATYTLLQSVQYRYFEAGKSPETMPPVAFSYTQATIDPDIYEVDEQITRSLPAGVDSVNPQWVDLYGEGVQGILYEDSGAWWYRRNKGDKGYYQYDPTATSDTPELMMDTYTQVAPKPAAVGTNLRTLLTDLNSDGLPELQVQDQDMAGYYEQDTRDGWKHFKTFKSYPTIDWNDPNLRLIDLTGDGYADILFTEEYCLTWYASLVKEGVKEGYTKAKQVAKALDENNGPAVVFEDREQVIYLADMSGDGLTDIVRVRNGSIGYWPNLGYGHFGKLVRMDNAPYVDHPDLFDRRRVRLADIDGTGTVDFVYFYDDKVEYWPNESGNSWGNGISINHHFPVDDLSTLSVTDLFGNGTACLVSSSPLPGDAAQRLRYIDLMSSKKPFLLQEVDNNMGALTRLQYAPSTQFYLRDERAGTPWATKLPFPVQVLERVEVYDQVTGQRLTTRYAYHHGYYDGVEREFRGFGRVDQWDTEEFDVLIADTLFGGANLNENASDYVAPTLTKTWFHVGHYTQREPVLDAYSKEYYQGDALSPEVKKVQFSGNLMHAELSVNEEREALRALRGTMLRQELYANDQEEPSVHPYQVVEAGYTIKCLQPRVDNRYAVFFTYERETLTMDYERNPADPRMAHSLTLKVDDYGNVEEAAAIGYPRRNPAYGEQGITHTTFSENTFINILEETADFYRLGLPETGKSYELTGLTAPTEIIYGLEEIRTLIATAAEIPFEVLPANNIPEKCLLTQNKVTYYSADLSAELPLGEVAFHALPYQQYVLALTSGLITEAYGTKVDNTLLISAEAGYSAEVEGYWQLSPRQAFDALHFYLPVQNIDPLGNALTITYDSHFLLPVAIEDALGNRTESQNDYRVLQPREVKDPNQNRRQVGFDVRGMVVATAIMGKEGETDPDKMGDTLADPTMRMEYELFNWSTHQQPNFVHTYAREQHGAVNPRFQESYLYTGGLGQEVLTKAQAEPGPAFTRDAQGALMLDAEGIPLLAETNDRWIGNGRTVLNNKGEVVRQYEPYFSSTFAYEDEDELRQHGVTIELFYDPVGRVIKTMHPDGSLEKVVFDPWQQANYDRNDTVLESTWYSDRNSPDPAGPEPADAEQRAAWLAAQHADTPQRVHLDTLARPFLTIDNNGALGHYETRNGYDIKGNVTTVTDAKNHLITTNRYNLLDELIYTNSMDAGERWIFSNVLNNPIRMWDSRGQAFRNVYDVVQRPRENYVKQGSDPEKLITFVVYGEGTGNPEVSNLRGQVYQMYDAAGLVQSQAFDFKGNLLQSFRQYAKEYATTPDWSTLPTAPDINTAATALLENESFTQQVAYDALNRPVAMTMPDSSVIKPTFNEANLLETVEANLRGATTPTSFVTNIDYNARGQREKIVYGNGSQTRYTYNPNTFRLTRLLTTRNNGASTLQDLNYVFDAVGNITVQLDNAQQTTFFNNAQVEPHGKYTYDALYRLLQSEGRELVGLNAAPGPGDIGINPLPENTQAMRRYVQQYEYDELGNILKMIHQAIGGSWTRYYHYDVTHENYLLGTSNDNVAPTTPEYSYDVHGSMLSMSHLSSLSWDFADRLQQVELGGGGTAYYVYDGGGERVRKVVERNGGLKEERFYLGNWEVFRKTVNGTVDIERESLHLLDDQKRVALVDTLTIDNGSPLASPTQTIRYQLDNHLGSASLELDDSAAVISYEEYYPFGTTSYRSGRNATETSLKRYRYVGKERDEETGLYYYGARYYAAWLVRFVSVDPLKDDYPYYTPYQYAGNKPINSVDIDGLEAANQIEGKEIGQQAEQQLIHPIDNSNALRINEELRRKKDYLLGPRDEYEKAILEGDIYFTANYGWVDDTHAFTDTKRNEPYIGVGELWRQLENEPSSDQIFRGYYSVNYKQDIVIGNFSVGIERQYLVKPNLSIEERKSIALAIFQDVSMAFEQLQGIHPTSGSSFEPADLPSNMLSFYRNVEGLSKDEIKEMIQPLSPKQSLEVYRSYPGTFTDSQYKNRSFEPRYFDTPYTSSNFGVPDKLNTIKPASISSVRDFGTANLILFDQDMIKRRKRR
ncbi:toxin [Fulvivirga sp. M361]|uniref:SpvB/TcaC N-terminal domain-containing protein n=1 Tax=Fulvivirga sp. M361 TaxID=2594266 RepID=UPI00117A9CF4|nr:SpvB/TcaC N-terminal domain-containing protein [Fulvivirga sp. M361]TRX60189.1 toxin [Fulvivirga sp. M361]